MASIMNNTIQFFNCWLTWVLDKIKDKFVHYIDISITSQDSFPTYKAAFILKSDIGFSCTVIELSLMH